MKAIYTSLRTLACIVFLTGIFAACTDGNEWDVDASKAALFRVRNVSVPSNRVAAQSASVSWTATSTAEYYIIEVSTEALSDDMEMGTARNSIVYGENKSITSVPAMLTGLTKESTYYLRVKSFGSDMQSGWAYLDGSFTTTSEDILQKEFTDGDITGESILVKWSDAGLPVTHLVYEWEVATGSEVATEEGTHELTSEEISAQSAIISGLQPGTKYVIYIYNNEDLRGITEATTEQILNVSEVLGGSVTLSWAANGIPVTKLSYYSADDNTNPTTQELTEQEINAGNATISGLALGQTYTFTIYNDEALRGVAEATTEQIMFINEADVRGKSVTVTWAENGTAVTKLTYQAANGEETTWEGELTAVGTDVTGLEGLTEYTFRVYTSDVLRGEQTVTTLAPMIDVTITAGITNATFKWDFDEGVAAYSCTAVNNENKIISLTDEEIAAGIVTVNDLAASTQYSFTLFNGNGEAVSNGQIFQTLDDPLAGYTVIELSEGANKQEFIDAINNNSGKVAILITEGAEIDGTGISIIPKDINSLLIWGSDNTRTAYGNKPKLNVNNWYIYGAKEKIEFFNLDIEANGNSSYVLQLRNQNIENMGNIEDIQFNSCYISNTAGVFSVRDCSNSSPIYCRSVSYNDCVVSKVGNYSLVHVEGSSNYFVSNISIKNTTAFDVARCIVRIDSASPNLNCVIDYCTFYNSGFDASTSDQWLRISSSSPKISISNTLCANLFIRTNPDNLCNIINGSYVFYTNDCTGDNYANYWSTKLDYSAATLFKNPTEGDFTVQIPEYAIYGDPRWNNE